MSEEPRPRILIVDDDAEMAEMVADALLARRFRPEVAVGGKAALAILKKRTFDAVVTDLRMEDVDGLDVLAAVLALEEPCPVIMMTAFGSVDGAVEAVRRGAFHYLTKPFKLDECALWLERAVADRALRRENAALRKVAEERTGFQALVGRSPVMQQVYDLLERVAATTSPVLILGESGTGKELVARALHFGGKRARAPFVAVNCAAMSATLLESELFGHARGAFTGATEAKKGLFVEADGGTLFLDEVGEIPIDLQSKLLRALETGVIRPVGGSAERAVDVRIVAATNRDLARAVHEKAFREDLYYRLHVVPIHLPPLRARREDIAPLVDHFVARFVAEHPDGGERELAPGVLKRMIEQPWPGNVRELKNTVERLLVVSRGKRVELRDYLGAVPEPLPDAMAALANEVPPLRVMQRRYVEWVLAQYGGNKVRAAQKLGIDASTIHRMLARDEP